MSIIGPFNGTKGISPTSKIRVYDKTHKHQTSGLKNVEIELQKIKKAITNSIANNIAKLKANGIANMVKQQKEHEKRIKLRKYRLRHTKSLNRGTHKRRTRKRSSTRSPDSNSTKIRRRSAHN